MDHITIATLIAKVAFALSTKGGAASAEQIVGVLPKLFASGLLSLPEMTDLTNAGNLERAVTSLAKQVQVLLLKLRDQAGLPAEGGLDTVFAELLKRMCLGSTTGDVINRPVFKPAMHGQVNVANLSDAMREIIGDSAHWLRVFVPDDMPWPTNGLDDGQARSLFQEACVAWQSAIGVRFRFVHVEGLANVILRVEPIDGTGGELANATVGSGPGTPLTYVMTFDASETWTPDKFRFACEHELGHMLGLDHSSVPGSLMQAVVQLDAAGNPQSDGPQPSDISLAQQLWGEPIA